MFDFYERSDLIMSKYQPLRIYSYNHPEESTDIELDRRINGYGTVTFPLVVNPINKREGVRLPERYNLFMVPVKDIVDLIRNVVEKSQKIKELISKLPGVAYEQFFNQMLVKEIKGTNDIENVSSTTEEINNAINNQTKQKKNIRLTSFVNMYTSIREGKVNKIESLSDIRKLYDSLLEGEIPQNKLPDGKLFRDGFVRIGNSVKTVHFPKQHENEINEQLERWIDFINDDEYISVIKACVAHYYFEYVHPFYDGNGRLGRYIFCSYIGKKLDPYTAVSLSHQINLKKVPYYDGFAEVEDKKNHGEITFFVKDMLNYLSDGQDEVIDQLQKARYRLDYVKKELEKRKYSIVKFNELYIYSQAYLFNDFEGSIEDRELFELFKQDHISRRKFKEGLAELQNEGLIETVKAKPLKRRITAKFLEQIGLDA